MQRALYVVVVNVPGFMPEDEPAECMSWEEACDTLLGELWRTWETDPRASKEADLDAAIDRVRRYRGGPPDAVSVWLGAYAHSIDRL